MTYDNLTREEALSALEGAKDAVQDAASQIQRLQDQVVQWKRVLAYAVMAAGGEVRIPEGLLIHEPDFTLEEFADVVKKEWVVRVW